MKQTSLSKHGTPPTPAEARKARAARQKVLADHDRLQEHGVAVNWDKVITKIRGESAGNK